MLIHSSAQPTANEDKGLEAPASKDEDPDALKFLASPDILDTAAKLLQPLTSLVPNNVEVWVGVYDVAIRRGGAALIVDWKWWLKTWRNRQTLAGGWCTGEGEESRS